MTQTDPVVEAATRRVVGIAALRQLRKQVDQELALESGKARWATRVGVNLCVATICAVSWLAFIALR